MRTTPANRYIQRFITRTDALVSRFDSPLPRDPVERQLCRQVHVEHALYLVIRLQQVWADFCRELVLLSALGRFQTLSGRFLPPAPSVGGMADIQALAAKAKMRLAGPGANWHLPHFAVQLANSLSVANYAQISSGLGAANVSDLTTTRNYIVHPNIFTRQAFVKTVRNLGLFGVDPYELLISPTVGGAKLFEIWVADLQMAAGNAVY